MPRTWHAVAAFGLALLAAARVPNRPPQTLALSSVELPDEALVDSNWARLDPAPRAAFDSAVRHWYDSLITAQLTHAGFRVVPRRIADGIWRGLVDSVHGFYNPLTGARIEEEYRAVVIGTARELRARHAADAWLRPRVEVVDVSFQRGRAAWDGASEGLGPGVSTGRAFATSVVVELVDSAGVARVSGRGGLKLLVQGMPQGRLSRVAWSRLFSDPKRNDRAIALALDSIFAYVDR